MMVPPFSGGCACGAIRYTVTEPPLVMVNCHCRDCQHASGGAYASGLLVASHALAIDGEPTWYESLAASGKRARRGFCGTCGSPLFADGESSRGIAMSIKAASLDDPSVFKPALDMWMASAQPWACTDLSLPKFDRLPV